MKVFLTISILLIKILCTLSLSLSRKHKKPNEKTSEETKALNSYVSSFIDKKLVTYSSLSNLFAEFIMDLKKQNSKEEIGDKFLKILDDKIGVKNRRDYSTLQYVAEILNSCMDYIPEISNENISKTFQLNLFNFTNFIKSKKIILVITIGAFEVFKKNQESKDSIGSLEVYQDTLKFKLAEFLTPDYERFLKRQQ